MSAPYSHGAIVAPAVLLYDLIVAHLPAALCLRHLPKRMMCCQHFHADYAPVMWNPSMLTFARTHGSHLQASVTRI